MKKILSAALLAVLCGSGTAFAADKNDEGCNTKQFSVGYEGVFAGDVLQGLSSRYWFNNNVGGELNLYYGRVGLDIDSFDTNADLFLAELKMLYAPVVKQNSRFYLGLSGGVGSIGGDLVDDLDVDVTVYTISPFVGTEFRFSEIPDLCFNWEVGYKFHRVNVDSEYDDVNLNIDGTFVTLGAHYYF
ncbi:MAG: hypothetical protein JW764_01380 [Chlorobiaceae bacterium]|nr:hypothetical protein [Chlorobiaceae bacterium]